MKGAKRKSGKPVSAIRGRGRSASTARKNQQSVEIARYHREGAERMFQAARHYSHAAKSFADSIAHSASSDALRQQADEHLKLAADLLDPGQNRNLIADVDADGAQISKTIIASKFRHCMLSKLGNPPDGWNTPISIWRGLGGGLYHVWYVCRTCFPLMDWPDVENKAINTLDEFAQFVEQFYRDNGGHVVS